MARRLATRLSRGGHQEIHVVAGCAVVGIEADGSELVERVDSGEQAAFWGHYRVAADGRQVWLADFDELGEAMNVARAAANGRPFYVEESGKLRLVF